MKNINKIMKGGTSKFDFLKTPLLMFFNFLKNVIIKPYNIGIELLIISDDVSSNNQCIVISFACSSKSGIIAFHIKEYSE
jgi:hypothetical protein